MVRRWWEEIPSIAVRQKEDGQEGDGRGNLRENREDPAPTVGIDGEDIKTSAPNK